MISKALGLLALLAITACGKNGSNIGMGGGTQFFNPLVGPGISQSVGTLSTQLANMSMSQGLQNCSFNGGTGSFSLCSFKTKEYSISYNSGTWLGFINYNFGGSTSQIGSTITTTIVSVSGDVVQTSNGTVTKNDVLNRIFHPELDPSLPSQCGGTKSIANAQTSQSGNGVNILFTIQENCAGVTKYTYRSHYVDLSYPLIMNPIQKTDYTVSNGNMNPSKAVVNSY
jgi:hypothetical protein